MNKILDYFCTSDIGLTTVLSLFYPIDSIDRTNPLKVVFLFKREAGLDGCIQAYWNCELTVEPQRLLAKRRQLQIRINET